MWETAKKQGKPTVMYLWISFEVSGTWGLPDLEVPFEPAVLNSTYRPDISEHA